MTPQGGWGWVLVFSATAAADFAWTAYIRAASAGVQLSAALWSALIVALGSIAVVEYTSDHALVWAAVVGAFVGTYLSMGLAGGLTPPP